MSRMVAIVLGWMLALGSALAQDHDVSRPMLLVAKPALKGPYSHTVLLAVPRGDRHVGFILNRSTGQRMGMVFPDHPPSQKVVEPIYFGGPEAVHALFALVRRDPGEGSLHLFGDLYMTGHASTIDGIIEQTPNEARYFAGFVAWRPHELEAELRKGFWYVDRPDIAEVFRKGAGEAMWREHYERLGNAPRRLEARKLPSGAFTAFPPA